jgi:hypothetical protein
MSNTLLSPTAITKEFLRILHNNLSFTKGVNRQYNSDFANSGATMSGKIGPSLRVRKPNRYTVRTGAAINVQDVTEDYVTVNCTTQKGVDMRFSSADLTLTIDEFSDRYIKPAALLLASTIDYDGLTLAQDVYSLVGTAGTTPGYGATSTAYTNAHSPEIYLNASAKLNDYACPIDERTVVLNPAAQAATVAGLSGLFNPQATIGQQYTRGEMGYALGMDFKMDQNVNRLTCGSRTANSGENTVSTASQTGSSLVIGCTGSSATATFKVGDVFYVSTGTAVNQVNPETKQSTGNPQFFVVTASTTAASSTATLSISPSIITSGATQTVTASPDAGASLVFIGTASTAYPQNLLYHKDAFTLVTADLVMPRGVDFAAQEVYDGISCRIVRQYDINNDNLPCRLDILYGWTTLYPQFACRIIG